MPTIILSGAKNLPVRLPAALHAAETLREGSR